MNDASLRLLVVGAGRMGQAIAEEARSRGHTVVGVLDRSASLTSLPNDVADCAIEFTVPTAAESVCLQLVSHGLPVVSGTTGWSEGLERVQAAVRADGGAFVHSANYAIGVQLLLRGTAALAAAFAGQLGFDAVITETHHARKLDAPSGTARLLQDAARAQDATRSYPITSVRLGHVPGTHELQYDGAFEQITLRHEVRDRRIFAVGAVTAAERLTGRTGVVTFADLLFGEQA